MGCCGVRCNLIAFCFLQLLATIQRQVLEIISCMWVPVIGNFINFFFIFVGLVSAYKYKHRILIIFAIWCLIWFGWNLFIICFHFEIGLLRRDMSLLNMGYGHKSWWFPLGYSPTCYANYFQLFLNQFQSNSSVHSKSIQPSNQFQFLFNNSENTEVVLEFINKTFTELNVFNSSYEPYFTKNAFESNLKSTDYLLDQVFSDKLFTSESGDITQNQSTDYYSRIVSTEANNFPATESLPEGFEYYYIEALQAGLQCILTVICFCLSCLAICIFYEEEDSSQPVHDELEYIKMRYRPPARHSFRSHISLSPQRNYNHNSSYDPRTTKSEMLVTAKVKRDSSVLETYSPILEKKIDEFSDTFDKAENPKFIPIASPRSINTDKSIEHTVN